MQKHYIFKNVHTLIKKYFIVKNNSLLLEKNAEHSVSGTLFSGGESCLDVDGY